MATTSFPNIIPSNVSFGIKYNTQINVSSLSGSIQTIEIPGARWVANLAFNDLEDTEGRVLAAYLAELRGASGRFYLYDHSHASPRGTNLASGTVLVSGASQVGNTLITSGWTINETGILLKGDYIEIGVKELKIITIDANSDGSGLSTLTFDPPIRTSPGDTTVVVRTNAEAQMLLDNDEIRWNTNNPGLLTTFNFSCTEGF